SALSSLPLPPTSITIPVTSPLLFFFLLLPPPPRSTLFPYTTLFRSLFRIMDDFPVFLLCIRHPDPGKPSDISILPSAFRKEGGTDRKSTRLNSSHVSISYAVFCLKKKKQQ